MKRTAIRRPLLALAALLLSSGMAAAHPMGNFSINHHSTIRVSSDSISIQYILDFAEVPTFQMFPDLAKAAGQAENWAAHLKLLAGGRPLALRLEQAEAETVSGAAGLPTVRIKMRLAGSWNPHDTVLTFKDENYVGRLGWKEIVIVADSSLGFPEGNAYASDLSNGLTNYPVDLVASAPDAIQALVRVAPGALNAGVAKPAAPISGRESDRLTQILSARDLPLRLILVGMLVAFSLGAFHALSPGHGKTVVAAYLVGNRGAVRHAVFLGAVVTFTHTVGVFLLGIVTLFLSRYIVPEKLFPWMGFLSGLIILSIGVSLFRQRMAGVHDHTHEIPEGITFRNLLALGFSGGIVPCPSALVVLLSAIALHRIEAGILFIFAFSLGLASVLVGIGVLVVRARRWVGRLDTDQGVLRFFPVLSACLISLIGLGIAIQSLAGANLLSGPLSLQGDGLVILGLGLFLGLKHATDADHIVAVTTFVSQEKSLLRSCWIGAFWGMGHTLSLSIAGLLVIVFKINIPEWLAARLELAVAFMLVGLGARAVFRALKGRIEFHPHEHVHTILPHGTAPHTHSDWAHVGLKPLLVGMVHGAAGSAALMLLVLSTIRSPLEALLYIVIFGMGSILGMLAISFLLALPQYWARGRMAASFRPIPLMAGLFSCLFGLYLGAEIWSSLP